MKSYLLVAPLLVLLLNSLFAEIRNGYEDRILGFRISLQRLEKILAEDELTSVEKRKIKQNIKLLVDFMAYHELTEVLLRQFQIIAPELYNEIDTLKDSKGRIVDVYVKFIPKEQALVQAAGMASFKQVPDDLNSCESEYGRGSISINVWIWNRALHVLSHEFGHVSYLVPNLASYVEFYKKQYRNAPTHTLLGHTAGDPSGRNAYKFEARFDESYFRYLKADSHEAISPLALINPIRRNLLLRMDH